MKFENREENLLKIYLEEIDKIPLLSAEEEKELARKIKEGDSKALKKLIESNLRLVVHFAVKFKTPGISIIDLINEGNLALIKAAQKFNPEKDVRFATYAKWWIRNSLWQVLTQKYPFSLSANNLALILQVEKVIDKLKEELGRMPSFEEIKEKIEQENKNKKKGKINVNDLKNLFETAKSFYSLSSKVSGDEELTIEDIIEGKITIDPETDLIRQNLRKEIISIVNKLSDLEKKVIEMRYGLGEEKKPLSYTEISKKINLSRERIRQIEKKALLKLRKISQYKRLDSFLN